uniref:Uncharacterized protein n=1 Tax=viral metagenome TaxID=1070528 RepID=A0A6C0IA44_9ZZZZ
MFSRSYKRGYIKNDIHKYISIIIQNGFTN